MGEDDDSNDPETTEGVYDEDAKEEMAENDELEPWEEGFVEGANEDGKLGKCANCGKMITEENCVEKKIEGELCRFCSDKCLEKYQEKHEEE